MPQTHSSKTDPSQTYSSQTDPNYADSSQTYSNQVNPKRHALSLSDHLNKHLLAYMATASAAGVSMLAMTQPAEATVVYTPAHRTIVSGAHLDLNGDGIPDFTFQANRYICGTCGYFDVFAPKPNRVMSYGSPQAAGVTVGPPGDNFKGHGGEMVNWCTCSGNGATGGPWVGIQNGYMGLEFNIKGTMHFGWARFSVTDQGAITLTGFAYETVALKPIVTGDTGGTESVDSLGPAAGTELPRFGLGHLALGAVGKLGR